MPVRQMAPVSIAVLLLAACGGSTTADGGDAGGSAGGAGSAEAGGPGGMDGAPGDGDGETAGDGGICFVLDPSSYDRSCQHATDCLAVMGGPICSGYNCICPAGAAISVSEQARYESALSSIPRGSGPFCGCPAFPGPQCIQGVCTYCDGAPSDPPACHSTAADAGPDGAACANVDLSTYDQSCTATQDCIEITAGVLCPGACTCGGAAVNVSERLRYDNAILQLGSSTACPCAPTGPVACVENRCTICGLGPNQPPGCPDAG